MNRTIKTADNFSDSKHIFLAVIQHVFAGVLGFVCAGGSVQSAAAPFGVAFAAAAPKVFTPAAVLGAAAGYFSPSGNFSGLKYIAALSAVAAIKYMLYSLKSLHKSKWLLCLTSFLALILTTFTVGNRDALSLISGVAESILSAAATFFFFDAFFVFKNRSHSPDSLKLCSVIIAVNLVLLGLFSVEFFDVSAGRLLASLFLLAAARYGKASMGAVAAISVGACITLYSLEYSPHALAFCVAGLMAGIFSSLGKIACSLGYILTFVLLSLLTMGGEISVILSSEAVFAAAIFLILPKSLGKRAANLLSPLTVKTSQTGKCNALTMRLNFAASALNDVSKTVDNVARELSKINCPDFEDIVCGTKSSVCTGCTSFNKCWDSKLTQTLDYTAKMATNINMNLPEISPEEFKNICIRRTDFENCFKEKYNDFYKKLCEEDRLEQVRSVVKDQFDAVAEMLGSLSEEFGNDETYDSLLADKIACALRELGVIVNDCGCRTDKFGRMTIEIRVVEKKDTVFNRTHILRRIEDICERDFENPCIFSTDREVLITLSEKAVYTLDTYVRQINSNNNAVSGDSYSCFYDGKGRYIMLLSDGMGNGSRAAVDGALATNILTRLIKAGFGWDCALKILNSSMLFKSTDESLATIDAVCIDLFTGRALQGGCGAHFSAPKRAHRQGAEYFPSRRHFAGHWVR